MVTIKSYTYRECTKYNNGTLMRPSLDELRIWNDSFLRETIGPISVHLMTIVNLKNALQVDEEVNEKIKMKLLKHGWIDVQIDGN